MSLKSAALLNSYPATMPDFSKHEYRAPPKDYTVIKCEIVRACWVNLDGQMQAAKPGQVLQIPRWLANELSYCGKASLL